MTNSASRTASLPRLTSDSVLIFDLDNTLYPAACDLFSQVSDLIGQYVRDTLKLEPDAAYRVQKDYFHRYGTTLRGLTWGRSPATIVLRARVLEAAADGSVVVRRLWDRELEFGRQ